jgi:CO/xanthine dehydrogenase Mo-binding subunit
MPNLGAESVSGGLRGNIMRTPGQRQQNFALEGLINEAAASAKVDPIQFRIDHTTDERLIDLLNATALRLRGHAAQDLMRNAIFRSKRSECPFV